MVIGMDPTFYSINKGSPLNVNLPYFYFLSWALLAQSRHFAINGFPLVHKSDHPVEKKKQLITTHESFLNYDPKDLAKLRWDRS